MTSLKSCCATGSLHTGIPTGSIAKLHGLDCYISAPTGPTKGVVVIIADALGWTFPNSRILADDYAKHGFRVYLPEFMVRHLYFEIVITKSTDDIIIVGRYVAHGLGSVMQLTRNASGTGVPEEGLVSLKAMSATGLLNQIWKIGHAAWLFRYFVPILFYCRESVAGPRIYNWLKALKSNEAKDLPIGTAGFCWGGFWVTRLCSDEVKADDGSRLIVCGYTAHPSRLTYPDDIEKIALPYSCAASEFDYQMSSDNAKQTEEILKAKTAKSRDQGIEHEFVMYKGAHHGFAVRADEDDKHEAEQGKKAEAQAVAWFTRWFANA